MSTTFSDDDIEILPPSSSVIEAQERANIDMQVATAKKYPRGDLAKIKANMIAFATLDQETAASCFYTLERQDRHGNKVAIEGPSVRLAEIAVSTFKNIRAGSRIVNNDGKFITAQGVCFDLENNIAVSMENQRSIASKTGKTFSQDMQTVTGNAAGAIAYRNAVFKVIPAILIEAAYEAARKASVGNGPMLGRWQGIVKLFAAHQVSEKQLIAWLALKEANDVRDEHLIKLRGLYTSFKDGQQRPEEVFADIASDGTRKSSGSREEQDRVRDEKLKQQAEDSSASVGAEETPREKVEEKVEEKPDSSSTDKKPQQKGFANL